MKKLLTMAVMLALLLGAAAPAFAQDDFQDRISFNDFERHSYLDIDYAINGSGNRVVVITDEF